MTVGNIKNSAFTQIKPDGTPISEDDDIYTNIKSENFDDEGWTPGAPQITIVNGDAAIRFTMTNNEEEGEKTVWLKPDKQGFNKDISSKLYRDLEDAILEDPRVLNEPSTIQTATMAWMLNNSDFVKDLNKHRIKGSKYETKYNGETIQIERLRDGSYIVTDSEDSVPVSSLDELYTAQALDDLNNRIKR